MSPKCKRKIMGVPDVESLLGAGILRRTLASALKLKML